VESQGSVTKWIGEVRKGDEAAAQQLWERYFQRLLALCRKRIPGNVRQMADEEDVVLSVFDSFYRRARGGSFPQLNDRNNFWHLLVVMTARKALNYVRDQHAQQRAPDRVERDSIERVIGDEPTPEFAAMFADEMDQRFSLLPDDTVRNVAHMKMEGYQNNEIAEQLGCSLRSVERKLFVIRKLWSTEDDQQA